MSPSQAVNAVTWPDERLVRECCRGNQDAWSALIDKYKNLIFSVPIKFGLPRDEAADVFQAVCVEVLAGLSRLREPRALPKWLMQISYHQCLRWKRERLNPVDDARDLEHRLEGNPEELPEEMFFQALREQSVRNAISSLPERCNRMVVMLFFEDPPRTYEEVAKELQLATGSIGFIRGRCLRKLRQRLEEEGFK